MNDLIYLNYFLIAASSWVIFGSIIFVYTVFCDVISRIFYNKRIMCWQEYLLSFIVSLISSIFVFPDIFAFKYPPIPSQI